MSHKEHDRADTSRRTILKVGALTSLAAIGGGVGMTSAQSETEVTIEIGVNPEEEYITLRNYGDNEVDLTGYSLNFDAEGGNDQIRQLSGDIVLASGVERTVATGEQTTIETDYSLVDPYSGDVLANDGSDVVALLDPDGNEVARSDGRDPNADTKTGIVTVVDQNGDPVEGEPVRLVNVVYEGVVEELTTDENGEATLVLGSSDPSDVVDYDVEVRDQTKPLTLDSDEEFGVSVVTFEVDNTDEPSGEPVVVTATDASTGEPIEGATVHIMSEGVDPDDVKEFTFETDAEGRVEEDVDIGSFAVTVSAEGYGEVSSTVSLEHEFHAELQPLEESDGGQDDQADEGDGDQDDTDDAPDEDATDDETDEGDGGQDDEASEGTTDDDEDCPKN